MRRKIYEGAEFLVVLCGVESVIQGGGQGLIFPTWDNLLDLVESASRTPAQESADHPWACLSYGEPVPSRSLTLRLPE